MILDSMEVEFWNSKRQIGLDEGYYLPTPPLGKDMTQGQFLSGV